MGPRVHAMAWHNACSNRTIEVAWSGQIMNCCPVRKSLNLNRLLLHTKKRIDGLQNSRTCHKHQCSDRALKCSVYGNCISWHGWDEIHGRWPKKQYQSVSVIRDLPSKDRNAPVQNRWKAEDGDARMHQYRKDENWRWFSGLETRQHVLDVTNGEQGPRNSWTRIKESEALMLTWKKKKQWRRLGMLGRLWRWGKPAAPTPRVRVCHRWPDSNPDLYPANPYLWPTWVLPTCGNPYFWLTFTWPLIDFYVTFNWLLHDFLFDFFLT